MSLIYKINEKYQQNKNFAIFTFRFNLNFLKKKLHLQYAFMTKTTIKEQVYSFSLCKHCGMEIRFAFCVNNTLEEIDKCKIVA